MRARWTMVMAVTLAAACHSQTSTPDARAGAGMLTIAPNAIGVITSEPAGIQCGQCALLPPSACADLTTFTQCSAEFPTGATVTLSIDQRQPYPDVTCVSADDERISTCTFVVEFPVTVEVLSLTW